MRTKIDLLKIFEGDRGGVSYNENLVMRLSRREREQRILEVLDRSNARPPRSMYEFGFRLLDRAQRSMALPGAPHERINVTDYGSGGSSGAGAIASASGAAAAAASSNAGNTMPWVFPSSDFLNFQKYGTIALPGGGGAIGTIISFKVPNGRYGKITSLGIDFVANGGAGFTQGVLPAQLTLNLAADGVPFQDFGNFTYLPGTASAPLAMSGLMIREGQLITLTVQNTGGIAVTTQFVEALIQGYYYSKNLQPKRMSYQ